MDFGLAHLNKSEVTPSRAGTFAGTPGYVAPELMRGHRPSRASDIFALGVLLHEIFTGEKPVESAGELNVQAAPSLETIPIPAIYKDTVRGFLSENPVIRCRALERFRSSLEDGALREELPQASHVWTRRQVLVASGGAFCAMAGGAIWKRDSIAEYLHPLPAKRFVALLGWPPSTDTKIKPILTNLIDTISNELARAEAYDRNLFLIPEFSSDVSTPTQLDEVRESLGANLILAASGARSSKNLQVSLEVLSPSSSRALRTKHIRVSEGEQLSLAQKAVHAAAQLLDIRHYEPSDTRTGPGTNNPEAYAAFQIAEALSKQSNDTGLEAAIEKYKEAIDLDRHYALATANLALAYCRLADVKHDPAATALARANAQTALAMDPDMVPARIALAGAFEQSGDETSALREMKRALAADPLNAQTLVWLSQAYVRLNHWQSAEDSLQRALQLRPNHWIAHNEFGVLLYKQGQYRNALSEFRTAALTSPKDVMTQSNVGFMYLVLGRFPEAIEKLKLSLSLQRTGAACVMMSAALRSKRDAISALPFAQEATALDASDCTTWIELGDCESMFPGHEVQAKRAYAQGASVQREALETNNTNGPGWILLALCEAKMGASQNARIHLGKAESLPSDDIDTQMSKARLLETLGQRDAALATLGSCFRRGATVFQVDLMPEMKKLQLDSRYLDILRKLPPSRTT